jgi:steroid 5-alpha reductase family enzyme
MSEIQNVPGVIGFAARHAIGINAACLAVCSVLIGLGIHWHQWVIVALSAIWGTGAAWLMLAAIGQRGAEQSLAAPSHDAEGQG